MSESEALEFVETIEDKVMGTGPSGKRRKLLPREKKLFNELFDKGISFKCADGQTSMPADKVRIIGDIGDKSDELENLVHAHLAAAGLRSALEVGGDRLKLFIEAILCVDDLPKSLAL